MVQLREHIRAGDGIWWGQGSAEPEPLVEMLLEQIDDIGPLRAFVGLTWNTRLIEDPPENLTVACRVCNKRRGTRPVVAFVRTLLEEGVNPRSESLLVGLGRLAASDRRDLAAYGSRQLVLLERLLDEQPGAPRRRRSTDAA